MTTHLQFGRSYREWWFVGLILSAAGLAAAGTALAIVRHEAAYWVLLGAGVAAISSAMSVVLISKSRFQVEILPQGFRLHDRHGEREFPDGRLICAGLSFRQNFSNGILKSTTRTFDLWAEGDNGPEQVRMATRLPIGAADPLAPFIERVQAHLYARANADLEAGETFEGEGWTLHQTELVVNSGRKTQAARIAELAAVGVYDDCLCVWKHGQDEPLLRIPVSSANTRVLQRLLGERIATRADGQERVGRLGRILFERKPDRSAKVMIWLLPVLFVVASLVIIIVSVQVAGKIAAVGLPACSVLLFLWLAYLANATEFRVCEHGVRRKWLIRVQELQYADIASFTYSAIRQYVKGAYAGTQFVLTFASREGGKWRKLTYSKTLRNADSELEHLRDQVSALIANRMQTDFLARRPVAWTDGLRFFPEGLEYRAAGFLGRKAPVIIPYSQIYGYDAADGVFHLWVHGRKKPVAKENVNKPNFYPGYHLLARLLAGHPVGLETAAT